jgi:hypothetical protein
LKKKPFAIFWLACLALTALSAGTLQVAKYPPGQRWQEISRGSFTVIFPATYWPQAEAALAGAESLNERLSAFWGSELPGRIRIVLDDSTDQANGFATFFPFNLVGVNLVQPPPDSELAGSRDWLDLVLAHELTHIFTMNAAAEQFILLRWLFGSQPLLYPAMQLPPWVIEGLAVYGESYFTGDGRLNHSPYPLMLAAARRDHLFPGWKALNGVPAAWPGSTGKYLFGAGFMEYLSAKYGADSLKQYLERSTSRMFLLSSSRDFKKTFGESLNKLWEEYRDGPLAGGEPVTVGPMRESLVAGGFSNQYPCPLNENKLVYYHRDYQGRGQIVMLDTKTGREKVLFKMDAVNGLSVVENGKKIFFSAIDNFRAFSEFSDLYEFNLKKQHLQKLSRGQRLSQPIKKDNAEEIYCVQRRAGRFFLALFDMRTKKVKTLSRAFSGFSQLSLSPDQNLIAAAIKPQDGPWGIGVFSTAGEQLAFVSVAGADCRQPVWQNNHRFYFIQADARNTLLATVSLDGSNGSACDDPRLAGLQHFSIDQDGQNIYFTYFSGRGLEIACLSLAGLLFSPRKFTLSASVPETPTVAPKIASRSYRFWRDVLPRYWATAMRMGGDEFQAGISTSGQDALGIHSYSLEGYYGFYSHRANGLFRYAYDGLLPTISFSYSDSSDFYRDSNNGASRRSQELKIGTLWPLRIRKKSQLYAYADVHIERRTVISDSGIQENHGSYNGCRLGLEFASTREYYDSISPADGVCVTMQYSIQPTGLGNESASRSAQADLRHYIPVFRPGVLAWRLALARSWNTGTNFYSLGGGEGESGSSLGQNHPFDLLRGFPAGYESGDRGWLFNLEYRLPLFKIEKAILPAVSLDRVYLNAFIDLGRLWDKYYTEQTAYSVGGEMVLRLAFGAAATNDLSFGAAYGITPEHYWRIYLRTGRSF